MKILVPFLFFLQLVSLASGQNPIGPPGVYLADPSARVWNDGKLYLFGSLDETCQYYCSHRYNVLSTSDMVNWEVHEHVFSSKGEVDEVTYNDKLLFAPDAAYANGRYYLYYCQPDLEHAEGVAVADSPVGPFSSGRLMDLDGYEQIDPAIFQDDDGQVYYLWGQFTLKMGLLDTSMKALQPGSVRDSILTESAHFFHEGAYLTKRNGIYYLVYADLSRGDVPSCLGYSTATSPYGPYTYRGVIIDNIHCNPANWNNHGSIIEFGGRWYVFYHRSTHGCNKMRRACVEPITFLPDGSISEVEMTSQGALPTIRADMLISAGWACVLNGGVRIIESKESSTMRLSGICSGDKAAFKYIDFGEGRDRIKVGLRPLPSGGKIVVSLDKPWSKRLAILDVPPGEATEFLELSADIEMIPGTHAVWLHFYGSDGAMFEVEWFTFE